jgi:exopolyphosphatase/guanosine-5'-triphosphate,3'-diphosphate pyrophosphatase
MKKNIIAIDLGSNSIRILKMDCNRTESISTFHQTVKTADGLTTTGKISKGALNRIINAINKAKTQIDFSDSSIKAVTTEAMRRAENRDEILNKIELETGVRFNIINGDDEAKYALIATKERLRLLGATPKSFVLADIGGASTELIFHYIESNKTIAKSFTIGIVTLAQSFKTLSEIANAISTLMNDIKHFCHDIYNQYGKVEQFIAIAGTPTTIASMKLGLTYSTYDKDKINGTILTRIDLVKQLKRLLLMSPEERIESVGNGREDLIASGVLIYKELYNICKFNISTVIDDGVREGVALCECQKSE